MATKKISNQFLLFLGVSALIWLLITLSKEYTSSLDLYVKFTNVPQDKMLVNNNVQQIKVDVKASGFKIIRTRIQNPSIDLDASFFQQNKQKKHYHLTRKTNSVNSASIVFGCRCSTCRRGYVVCEFGCTRIQASSYFSEYVNKLSRRLWVN